MKQIEVQKTNTTTLKSEGLKKKNQPNQLWNVAFGLSALRLKTTSSLNKY